MTVFSAQERYRRNREIGQGGMGEVWMATDTLLDRPVAIKYPLVTSSVSVGQLLQEARMLAKLNHPNITTLYDFFVEPGSNRFYLVMEYVDGKSLDAIIADGQRLPLEISLEIAQGILRALSYAHTQGVIHRDIKPANVMIADEVKLTDFGLANLAALLGQGTDHMAGTPAYMAPEQIEGRPTDGRADLYSLGVTLFELLSGGHLPFESTDQDEMLDAHLHTSPLPLSRFVPDIPSTLEQIIVRLLAKDTADRYPSAEAVMEVLNAIHVGPKLGNLPVPLTPFVGREVELAELKDRLQDPACRLLTLVGLGGSGKTRLALEAAAAQAENYAHGVFFVSLAPLDSVDGIIPTVAEALGFRFYDEGDPQQQLPDYLRQKTMLLILDNFEHLVEGAGLVTEILQTAAEVKILATSRVRLNVEGEHIFAVGGMSIPDRESHKEATKYSAINLFLSTVRRTQPHFEPTTDDLGDVAHICQQVEGIPLGILLAAAWVEMLTPAEIVKKIGQSLDFLETDLRDVPERQRSLRAVFDYSSYLLTEREREVFQALSVFRGGFTPGAAQQVSDSSLRELMSLINKSMLYRASVGRFEMHELLRQYAAEKLKQTPGAHEAAHDRHSAYYCAALQRWEADLISARQQTALTEMDTEIENARAAWNWVVERGQVERVDQALVGLVRFHLWRGRALEGEAACRIAAEKLAASASGDGLRVLAKVLSVRCNFNRILGRIELASQLVQQSLAILEKCDLHDQRVQHGKAHTLLELGQLTAQSDREEAKRLCEQSLALFQELGYHRWDTARALNALGEIAWNLGAYDEARHFHEKGLKIGQELGDQREIAYSLLALGNTARQQGQREESERLVRQSIAILRELGVHGGTAGGLYNLSVTLLGFGKFAESHSLLEESVAIYTDLGFREGLALSNNFLGLAEMHLGQYQQAWAHEQIGFDLSREIGYRRGIAIALGVLGSVASAVEAHTEARQRLEEAVAIYRELGQQDAVGWTLASLGIAERGLGHFPQAQQYLCQALQTAAKIGAFVPLTTALPGSVLLLADQGKEEQAVELYALAASRFPAVANSRWFEDVVGRHIAAVAATLSPEVVAAAQRRGQARDLWATVEELLDELG